MRISHSKTRRRPIGLTSLIDVIFLLLLFFMLASTFSHYQALPLSGGGGTATTATNAPRPALLRIHGEGRMDLNGRPVTLEDLASRLAELKENDIAKVAILSGEKANVQDVVSAMDAVEAAELSSILVAGR
ncbi:outer membrane transport energization protein ExbD [Breoghania corrubedonensis]|uniref:Outer membrane transport energization protein ExbD n=1 Tax=Breoghania corrubedonensis TaxID=665038 RepID=A0A2T5VCX9_9HYPH|nr:biopolymer transporter ExbD [Breoghania corrubedonensis]PTW61610.1 outer membrane transport energization protein ExbD [Breoghania corrubedonensis]